MLLELIGLDKHCSHREGTRREAREDVSPKDFQKFSMKERQREREEKIMLVSISFHR